MDSSILILFAMLFYNTELCNKAFSGFFVFFFFFFSLLWGHHAVVIFCVVLFASHHCFLYLSMVA